MELVIAVGSTALDELDGSRDAALHMFRTYVYHKTSHERRELRTKDSFIDDFITWQKAALTLKFMILSILLYNGFSKEQLLEYTKLQ